MTGAGERLRGWLAEPRLAGIDVDRPDLVQVHRQILATKPLTRAVFAELYQLCMRCDERYLSGDGLRVEIGAGSSFLKTVCPELIVTDIKPAPGIDVVVDAMAMPFAPSKVRTIFGIHTFHHLPDPDEFFAELMRVLVEGGGCVLIEPYHGPLAAAAFKRLFATEAYVPEQSDWRTPITGPMAGANQALSYVVFTRDVAEFQRRHPQLELVYRRPITNWIRYLLSGGLNFRTLAPGWLDLPLRGAELLFAPAAKWLALHQVIVLRKRRL